MTYQQLRLPLKAAVYTRYGPPDVLQLEEVERPTHKDDEVLIRVHAASVNSWDWDQLIGNVQGRLSGPFKPANPIPGADVAGRVEAVGKNVTRFQLGDEVFGDLSECGWGGFAEYACAQERVLVSKPAGMSFEQAASIPQAGLLALQGLRDKVRPGHRVLINGAGGGMGTFAIQLAKLSGGEVTGVDHTSKLDFMRSVGADHVIDYTQEDFTANGEAYDLILDAVARRSIFAYARALRPGGKFVMIGGTMRAILQAAFLGPLLSRTSSKRLGLLIWRPSTTDLEHMKNLFETGKVVPIIDRSYPLAQAAEALRHLGEGRAKGKVVITMLGGNEAGRDPQ